MDTSSNLRLASPRVNTNVDDRIGFPPSSGRGRVGAVTAAELPPDLRLVRTTPVFDETSVPAGLLAAHRVADGVWGRLVVQAGSLAFVFEDDPGGAQRGEAGRHVIIPPGRAHHLELDGPVRFVVEFYRPLPDRD